MYLSLAVSWWLVIPLAILAGGLLVRVFIIFHDCGHGSFLKSPAANVVVGFITGLLTFTPFHQWRWDHAIHHATSGHLDKRGPGDVWTLTVEEYLAASRGRKFAYRLAQSRRAVPQATHQFEDVYWEREGQWDYATAALKGSSFYKLPRVLQWFSGNIGYHHIHHLSARIPNYSLERCHRAHLLFQGVKPITLRDSLRSLRFRLLDESHKKLVGNRHLRELRRARRQAAQP